MVSGENVQLRFELCNQVIQIEEIIFNQMSNLVDRSLFLNLYQ